MKSHDCLTRSDIMQLISMSHHMHILVYDNTCPSRTAVQHTIQEGSLTVHPILHSDDSSFGAEVYGVDWSKPVPADIVTKVGYHCRG
jgi:alpha-ketoglutarate-dependent 2,4-dichlorophenoxyacetate dioxygenase